MLQIRLGDAFAVTQGMWAAYKSALKTMPQAEAIAFAEDLTNRTQPSFGIDTLSALQNGGSFFKLMTMFQNQPNKYFRIVGDNLRNFKYGRGSREKAAGTILLTWVILPMIFQYIADAFQWKPERQARAGILGPLNYILIGGQLVQSMWGWATGEPFDYEISPATQSINDIQNAVSKAKKLYNQGQDPYKDISVEDAVALIEYLAKAGGQVSGLPTPYLVQTEKMLRQKIKEGDAITAKDYVFSQWALEPPAKDAGQKVEDVSMKLGEIKEGQENLPLTDKELKTYTTKDWLSDMGQVYKSTLPQDVLDDPDASKESKAWAQYEIARSKADILPNVKLRDINTEDNADTILNYYQQWQARQKITSLEKLKEFDQLYPNANLGNVDRTTYQMLKGYLESDNKPEYLKNHSDLNINLRDEYLKQNPTDNALLAFKGEAKLLTQASYDEAQRLIKELDIPANAVSDFMPPADVADDSFKYHDAVSEFGAGSAEAMLIRANNPKLTEFMRLTNKGLKDVSTTNANIKYLESKIANRDLQEQRDALKDTYDDNVKDEKGLTELDRVRMKFDKSNPDYLKNDRLAEAYSFGADEAIANKWLEHGDVSDEFGSNTAEMKTWYLDNPGMHEWAVAHGKTEDDGLDWNEPVLRIKVKNRDLQEQYDALEDDDARLQFRKDNPEYTDDLARIKAYENDGEAFVDKVVEWNRISRDMPGQNAEEKVFWADNPDAYRWAVEHELIKDNMENWNIPALRLDAQWRDKDAEYQAILDKYGNSESKEQREATDAFWANPENKNFQVAWYSREGYKLGLTDDVTISKYVEFNQLPTYGKWRDRYKLENLGFFESVRALQSKKDRWEDLKPEEIPAIQYDQIYEDFKPQFKEYEESTEAEKKVMLEKYPKFRMARIRREGYSLQFPEKHIERYVEYMEIPKKGYADERYLKAHQDFYAEIFKRKGWTEAIDFALVPTEKVENDYNVYQKITSTSARNLFLVEHRELETWLIAKKLRTRPVSGTGKIQTESGAVKLARSWAGADKVRDIMQGRLVR